MALLPDQFEINRAWIVFRLNAKPIQTEVDGAFNCLALMDAASCFVLASAMIATSQAEPTQLEFRRLLADGKRHKKQLPKTLFVPRAWMAEVMSAEAARQGIEVVRVPEEELRVFTQDVQQGFRQRFG